MLHATSCVDGTQRGAAVLDYILASSVLFFVTTAIVTVIDGTARGYYRAALGAAGTQIDRKGLKPPIGFAPCGRHNSLGTSSTGTEIPDECL